VEKVAKDLEEVKAELEELNSKWIISDPFPKKTFKKTLICAIVIVLMGLVWEHVTITKCFLTPAQTGWSERTCAVLYPGYEQARKQSQDNLSKFTQVINTSLSNEQKIKEIEKELGK